MRKVCSKCKVSKELKDFYFIKKKNSYRSRCRICTNKDHNDYMKTENGKKSRSKHNEKKMWKSESQMLYKSHWSRKKKYGISEEQFRQMLEQQNNKCEICGILDVDTGKSLCIDHCHSTNQIRGLLCNKCNSAVGMVKESIDIVNNLKEYLIKYKK